MISTVARLVLATCLLCSPCAYADTVTSLSNGLWTDASTWSTGTIPGVSDEITINHQVVLSAGSRADVSSLIVTGHLVLAAGSVLLLSGTTPGIYVMRVTGIVECADGSELAGTSATNIHFEAGSRYVHRQGPSGFIPLATWDIESTLQVSGFVDDGYINLAHSNSWRQSFGHVEYDCPAQTVFVVDLNGHLRDIRGNFTIKSTNNKALRLSTTQQAIIRIGGNLVIQGPTHLWFTTNSANCMVTIGGDFLYASQGSTASYLATRGNVRLEIAGDWTIDAQSVLRMASSAADSTGSRQAWVTVGGDFTLSRGSLIAPPPGSGRGVIEFKGTSTQRVSIRQVANPLVGNLEYMISRDARVQLGESALVSERGALTVEGTLEVGSADTRGAIQSGASGGNIRIPGTRTFAASATVIYNGSAQQTMGDGHPLAPNTIIDNPSGVAQAQDLIISNNFEVVQGRIEQRTFSLTVEGNLILPGVDLALRHLRLSGARNQSINTHGASVHRLEVDKTSSVVELTSDLALTGTLQVNTATEIRSNGFLTLVSTSDDEGHTAAVNALPAGAFLTGDVIVQRFMSGEGRLYRYISSPVLNATVASLMDDFPVTGKFSDPSEGPEIQSENPSLFEYDEAAGVLLKGWKPYPIGGFAAEASLKVGRGYAAFVRNEGATVVDFIGPINQGEVRLSLDLTMHNGVANGWHLIGNPYPSAIAWDAVALGKVSVSNVIAIRDNGDRRFRYWDGDIQYNEIPGGRIASGQSFWVRAMSPGASLVFREAAKAVDASFYRRPLVPVPSIAIHVSNGRMSDHAILKLRPQGTDSMDVWDCPKLYNDTLNVSIASHTGNRLAIDCRHILPDSISLHISEMQPATYSLSITVQDSLSQLLYRVKDAYLQRTANLSVGDTLVFVITNDPTSAAADRFTIFIDKPSWHPSPKESGPGKDSTLTNLTADRTFFFRDMQAREWAVHVPPKDTLVLRSYPNPAGNELVVEWNCLADLQVLHAGDWIDTERLDVELFNARGMRMGPEWFDVQRRLTRSRFGINTPDRCVLFKLSVDRLLPGAYIMRVHYGTRSQWMRFLKI